MITEETFELVGRFNRKHGVGPKNQALMLGAELGELQDEVLKGNMQGVEEELADVVFVAISLSHLYGVDLGDAVERVTKENLEKDTSTEGSKVTKE